MESARRQTRALADVLEAHTTRLLGEADYLASLVAWEVRKHGVQLPLDRYVDAKVIQLDAFLQVAVIDDAGVLRASTVPGFKPVDLADREHFRVHLQPGGPDLFIGRPLVGRASGKPSIQLSKRIDDTKGRIDDAKGQFLGVVVVSMDPTYLTRLYDELPVGKHGAIAVIGANDMIIRARRSGSLGAVGMEVPRDAGLRAALAAAPAGAYQSTSFIDGVTRLVSYKRLAAYPLIVSVGFSLDDYLAAYRARRNFLLAIGVVISVLILFASGRQAVLMRRALVAAREERAAKESEAAKVERIEALFHAIPCAAMGLSVDLALDGLNHHLLRLLGTSREAVWGARPAQIAAAFFRDDASPDRAGKAKALAAALSEHSAEPRTLTVRVEAATAVIFEIEIEPRHGGGTVALFRDITLQSDVSASEQDLDITLRAISDAVISTDADGRIKRMNTMAERMTGLTVVQAQGRKVADVLRLQGDAASQPPFDPARDVLQGGSHLHFDGLRLPAADGDALRDVTVSAAPIHDADGHVRGTVLVVRDVTRERAAAAAVQESEARYRKLIEVLPCAVLVQQQGIVRYANPMAVRMLAAPSLESLLDRHVTTLIHPDYHKIVLERIQTLQNQGRTAPTIEQRWERMDGTALQCEVTAAPCDWRGQPSALVLLQDVNARKLAERQRDRFFELSLDLQCIANIAEGRLTRVNPAFENVLGWSADELVSRPFMDFVHPLDREATRREMAAHQVGVLTEHFENRWRCKDGSYRWLAWSAVSEPDGVVYATARDVTESLAAREQLIRAKADAESASRAKSAFLATMSHEIRTPMNGVIGMIEVLAQTGLSADQSNIIATVRESAASLLRIIDDILDFSKIEAGRMELEETPVSIPRLADSLCRSLQPVARKAGVVLDHAVEDGVPERILSDGTRLQQLLYNLVGNAIKFSAGTPDAPGRVALRIALTDETPARVRFSVIDNGIGIEPGALKTLFMPFTQAEVSTTRRFGGTGLGLAICRRIVDLMGGDITADSRLGEGATFTVTLPWKPVTDAHPSVEHGEPVQRWIAVEPVGVAQAPAAAPTATPASAHASAPASRPASAPAPATATGRILVAEDDEINQKVILRQLGLLGYQAEIANDGQEGLEHWRSGRYALILTDLHMPRLDGYEFARAVRREEAERGTRIPILALTANALRGEMNRAMAAGMDAYLTKPLHLSALKDHLERHFPRPARAEAVAAAPPATAGASAAAGMPVDTSVLAELVGDEEDTIRALLADFRESLQGLMAQLRQHRDDRMPRAVSSVAHKLKSSSRSVGAIPLGDLCALLENAGKAEKQDEIDRCLAQVEAESTRVRAHLDTLLCHSTIDGART